MRKLRETDLYTPVKAFLCRQGYDVKGEVGDCDVLAIRGEEEPVVVELKLRFDLTLVLQGIERQAVTDAVYLAVPGAAVKGQRARRFRTLCRRLGLGLLVVRGGARSASVEAVVDPGAYAPRKSKPRRGRLLREFELRVGDPNAGGTNGVKRMTAYRQDALRCAGHLALTGSSKLSDIRASTGVGRAGGILQDDVYGWFERITRGTYQLSPKGAEAVVTYAMALAEIGAADRRGSHSD